MRMILLILLAASIVTSASASGEPATPGDRPAESPSAYAERERLVEEAWNAGDYAAAYYHAAWLAWLAPRRHSESSLGAAFLRDTSARTRAARHQTGPVAVVLTAAAAQRLIADSCCNGAVAQQAGRLRSETDRMLARAEKIEAELERPDPVARIALARLCLSLDDALAFEHGPDVRRARLAALRRAVPRAAAVAAWLPESPGAHRTLAVVRSRIAELDSRPETWALAIAAAERAHQVDPDDDGPIELLWALNLRAGNWTDARRWQADLRALSPGECAQN